MPRRIIKRNISKQDESKSSPPLEPEHKKKKTEGDDQISHSVKVHSNQQQLFSSDVLVVIGWYSETIDIVKSMAHVCKDWNQAVVSDAVFCEIFKRDFGQVQWFVDKINYNLSIDMKASFDITPVDGVSNNDDDEPIPRQVPKVSTDKLTLSEIRDILERCFGKGKFWYSMYRLVTAFIPIQCPKIVTENEIVLPLNKKVSNETQKKTTKKKSKKNFEFMKDVVIRNNHDKDEDDEDEDEDCEDNSKDVSKNYFYFSLGLRNMLDIMEEHEAAARLIPALEYDLNTHKLGVILSLFDRHGLIIEYFGKNSSHKECLNKITKEYKDHQKKILEFVYDENSRSDLGALPRTPYIETLNSFLIGYDKDENHPCSILKFCYAILCEKENELFNGTRRDPIKLDAFDDDYDFGNTIGVGPNTEDAFMPYCSYEIIETPRYNDYSYGVSNISISMNPEYRSAMFTSSFPGWVRGFWNANFYWYHVVKFETVVQELSNDSEILLIVQDQKQILHNLC